VYIISPASLLFHCHQEIHLRYESVESIIPNRLIVGRVIVTDKLVKPEPRLILISQKLSREAIKEVVEKAVKYGHPVHVYMQKVPPELAKLLANARFDDPSAYRPEDRDLIIVVDEELLVWALKILISEDDGC
jgi:hypothetical protein